MDWRENKMKYGETLKKLRKEKKISQEELARYAGIVKSTISKYERGENKPTLETAKLIAEFLGTTVDQMVGNDDFSNVCTIDERNSKELYGLPKGYIKAIKLAFSREIFPEDLTKIIEMAYDIKKRK